MKVKKKKRLSGKISATILKPCIRGPKKQPRPVGGSKRQWSSSARIRVRRNQPQPTVQLDKSRKAKTREKKKTQLVHGGEEEVQTGMRSGQARGRVK